MLKRFYLSLFFNRRWYLLFTGIIVLFVLSYGIPFLFLLAQILMIFLLAVSILDYAVLFTARMPVEVQRELTDRLRNGDDNPVVLSIKNKYAFPVRLRVIDELPDQFQERHFHLD